jgi:8-oxo-dGTP pyrophosphatase MutT (NUDIX family)
MHILRLDRDLHFLPTPNESALILDDNLPPAHLITSALALAFRKQSILMTKLNARGWDIPGGHLERGESPEIALHREVREETGALLSNVRLLGYQHIRLLAPCPPNYRYPCPESYQTFFLATVADLSDFMPTDETRARALFSPYEAISLRWVQENRDLYEAALGLVMKKAQPYT